MSTAVAERSWCVVVPHHARGARLARQRLAAELGEVISPSLLADTIAVLAELVGNAIRHAEPLPGGVVRVAWRVRAVDQSDEVKVRITDGGSPNRAPTLRTAGAEAVDGRGLRIVVALSDQWGIDQDGLGQSVWAQLSDQQPTQLPLPDPRQPGTSRGEPDAHRSGRPAYETGEPQSRPWRLG